MAGGRALVFDCWLTAKGISLPGMRMRAERQELCRGGDSSWHFSTLAPTLKRQCLIGKSSALNALPCIQRKSGSCLYVDPKAEIPAISLKFPIPQAHFCVEYCLKVVRWAHRVFIGNIYIYYVVTGLYSYIRTKKCT